LHQKKTYGDKMSKYRIVEISDGYGTKYTVEKRYLFFFWFCEYKCSSLRDAKSYIKKERIDIVNKVVYEV
jgi:hypothetical protein